MGSQGEHILVADDEEQIRVSLSYILEDAGYEVTVADSGAAALKEIFSPDPNSNPVNLLLTDIQMPDINGFQLIDELRRKSVYVPTVVITGYGDKETVVELLRKGCVDFLDKPITPEIVIERVSQALENARNSESERIEWEQNLENDNAKIKRELDSYRKNLKVLRSQISHASDVYQKLLKIDPDRCNVRLVVHNRPLSECGGDFVDYRNTGTGCDLFMADVAGHDLGASYHTVLLKAFFDENCRQGHRGSKFLRILNEQLHDKGRNERLVTGLFLRINLQSMTGDIVSAGHPYPIRLRSTDTLATPLVINGDILGIHEEVEFEIRTFPLAAGDRLFLYTDGFFGAHCINPNTGEKRVFGTDRLNDLVEEVRTMDIETAAAAIWNGCLAFCRQKPADDMMLVSIEIPQLGGDVRDAPNEQPLETNRKRKEDHV